MFDLDRPEAIAAAEAYLALPRPALTRLPFNYRRVPIGLRVGLLRLLARGSEDRPFPSWPIEPSMDSPDPSARYDGNRTALLVTHDVDTGEELGLIDEIRSWERQLGVSSAWGFVPQASWPDEAIARRLVEDGCEVYWHDIGHDGRLPYQTPEAIRDAFGRVADGSPWAIPLMRAFRSGQLLMSPPLLEVVAERFAIDLSIPDSERGGPYGRTAGCGTVVPFRLHGLLEFPLSLPQDVFLRQVYGLSADEALRVWLDKLDHVKRVGGVAILNIHPVWVASAQGDLAEAFRRFLVVAVEDEEVLITTPTELASIIDRGQQSAGRSL